MHEILIVVEQMKVIVIEQIERNGNSNSNKRYVVIVINVLR